MSDSLHLSGTFRMKSVASAVRSFLIVCVLGMEAVLDAVLDSFSGD